CLLLEPALCVLGLKGIHEVTHLLLVHLWRERHEHAWLSQVAVVFRDLVLQNQVIPKRIPGQFRDQAVVLMRISAVMSEDHVRGDRLLQLFENRFDLSTYKRHEAVGESLQHWPPESSGADEQ